MSRDPRRGCAARVWAACLLSAGLLSACSESPELRAGAWAPGEWSFEPRRDALGAFELRWEGTGWSDARLRVFHRDRPDEPVWETLPGRAFLAAGRGRESLVAADGLHAVRDEIQERCPDQTVDRVEAQAFALRLSGRVRCAVLDRGWELIAVPEGRETLRLHVRLDDPSFDRLALAFARTPDERFAGFGQQADRRDPGGGRVPILVQRGAPAGPAGTWRAWWRRIRGEPARPASRTPAPRFVSSRRRALVLETGATSLFDLRAPDRVRVEVRAGELSWRIVRGDTLLDLVGAGSAAMARMRTPPDWIDRGVVVGVRGGAERLDAVERALRQHGVPVAAFEVTDWSGDRAGVWRVDRERYPGWDARVARWEASGIRVLLPVRPVVAAPGEGEAPEGTRFARAADAGYLVRDASGEPWRAPTGDGPVAVVDLSDAEAAAWWTAELSTLRAATGAAGWVAGAPPSPPWDATVAAEGGVAAWHNAAADAWSRVARRSLDADGPAAEAVLIREGGYLYSPRDATLFGPGGPVAREAGPGDREAGILSGGVSGFTVAHAVAAGEDPPSWRLALERAAFGPVLRTAPGLPLEDEATWAHLARMADVHAAWRGYRRELFRQASEEGLPVLRPGWLHHPDEPEAWAPGTGQWRVGRELLVAPTPDPQAEVVEVWLPPGRWIDAWSGTVYGLPGRSARYKIPVVPGRPTVLHPEGSFVGDRLRKRLDALTRETVSPVRGPGTRPR